MSRRHVGPVVRIALSPTKCATATGLNYAHHIRPAIEHGELTVYQVAGKRLITVSDLHDWIVGHPKLIAKTKR